MSSTVPKGVGRPQGSPPQAARVFLKIYINSSPTKGPGVPHNGTPTSSYLLLNKLDQPPSLAGCTSLGHPAMPVLGSPSLSLNIPIQPAEPSSNDPRLLQGRPGSPTP